MKKTLFLLIIIFFCSCTPEQKAKNAVKDFITTYATYPDSYEPIGFENFESSVNENGMKVYHITTMYRIRNSSGVMEVLCHKFELSEGFHVISAPFERVD